MNTTIALIVLIPFFVFVLWAAVSGWLAVRQNALLHEQAPDLLTYGWGYFMGYSGIIGTVLAGIACIVMIVRGFYPTWFLLLLIYCLALGIASYGILIRRKWGWAFQIPLSLNPGLWAFNSVYAHNRWREIS